MDDDERRPEGGVEQAHDPGIAGLEAASAALSALASARSLDEVLDGLLDAVRDLVDAPWAALGLPAEEGDAFARFTTSGMAPELVARLGALPRRHGLLATLLDDPQPLRLDDLHDHPDFRGAWPSAHPDMRAFLGVPVRWAGQLLGALYLARGPDDPPFVADDLAVVERFAAHAAVAVEHARREEQARELHTAAERARLAADLHDALSQALAGASYALEATASHLERARGRAGEGHAVGGELVAVAAGVADTRELLAAARRELAAVLEGLRPPRLDEHGLAATLRRRMEVLARAHGVVVADELSEVTAPGAVEVALLRIAEEALSNAVRHAAPSRVTVGLSRDAEGLVLVVADDGRGFDAGDPLTRATRLGLTTMHARAQALGGSLVVDSAPGRGTTVTATVPPAALTDRPDDAVPPTRSGA